MTRRLCAAASMAALLAILTGCATTARQSRPAPRNEPSSVPDAIPRNEARSSHGNPSFYEVYGKRYQVLASADGFVERGVASWYGPDFHGHNTSSGEPYDMYGMTAAHKTLPIPCYARITNLANGRNVVVRINDRGPFVANRIVDLSYTAAQRLDIVRTGTAFVELRIVGPATDAGSGPLAPPDPAGPPVAASPQQTPSPPATMGSAVVLYIQVGAYADEGNARRVVQRLQRAGLPGVFSLPADHSGQRLRRVRVGPIATVDDFDRLAARLTTLGFADAKLASD